jgi:hypothetical protein
MSSEMSNFNITEEEEMNFTSIYNETNIQNFTSPNTLADETAEGNFALFILCVKGFIFASIIIGALLGNALVILAVRKNRKLRCVLD